jgi:hypothetical protein
MRLSGSLLVVVAVLGTCGCGLGPLSAEAAAAASLEVAVAAVHEEVLEVRSRDPETTGRAVSESIVERLSDVEGVTASVATADSDGAAVDVAVGILSESGGGWTYDQRTLGACLRVTAEPGDPHGDVGQRGSVTTVPVPCADARWPTVSSSPVDAVTTDLDTLSDDVPRADPRPCWGTSGYCPGG